MKRLCEKKFLALCLVPFLGICCARAEEPEPQMLKNSPLSLQKPESSQSEPQQTEEFIVDQIVPKPKR